MKLLSKKLLEKRKVYDLWEEISNCSFSAEIIKDDETHEAQKIIESINSNEKQVVKLIIARTKTGQYIGDQTLAEYICDELGIIPERAGIAEHKNLPCQIGFCMKEQKWYGWSHRAIYGFGIGDIVEEGDCTATSGWSNEHLKKHPKDDLSLPIGFEAKSLDDAKRMAIAFADNVS